MKYTKISIFFTAIIISFAAHALHECNVIEYAELKDMKTMELEILVSGYHYNYLQLNNTSWLPANTKEKEREICTREGQRIAKVLNKRKNVQKSSICNAECKIFSGMNTGKVTQ